MIFNHQPLSVVRLIPFMDFPLYALVSTSGDSILLSSDNRVSTLINSPEFIDLDLGIYPNYLLENHNIFEIFNTEILNKDNIFSADLDPQDLLSDSLLIIRSIEQYKALCDKFNEKNSIRGDLTFDSSSTMVKAIKDSLKVADFVFDLSCNIDKIQNYTS